MTKLNKDGIARNIKKMKGELKILSAGMKEHWQRFRRKPWDSHAFYNLPVESGRLGVEYLMGHIWGTLVITQALTIGLLIWKW